MANHGIQKSKHLLKRLEEEMNFLSYLVAQMGGISSQIAFTSSAIKRTWSDIDHAYEGWEKEIDEGL